MQHFSNRGGHLVKTNDIVLGLLIVTEIVLFVVMQGAAVKTRIRNHVGTIMDHMRTIMNDERTTRDHVGTMLGLSGSIH